ncbi:MAG: hypothetical protein M0009_09620 [Deltaproteobacteria bacterium]|nr:hypothetical protein [Deltaproteobacteria bacterium]
MKIRALLPTLFALAMLIGAPINNGLRCEADPRGGLICYCCQDKAAGCTMLSCSGCGGAHHSAAMERWSPEMTFEPFQLLSPARTIYCEKITTLAPEFAYREVPDKPPNRV